MGAVHADKTVYKEAMLYMIGRGYMPLRTIQNVSVDRKVPSPTRGEGNEWIPQMSEGVHDKPVHSHNLLPLVSGTRLMGQDQFSKEGAKTNCLSWCKRE